MSVLMDCVRKIALAAGVTIILAASPLPAGNSEWSDVELETLKNLGDWATDFAKSSKKVSPITKALATAADRLKKSTFLETVSDKNMIRDEDLERMDTERREMDKAMPPTLAPMNDRGAYTKIVGDIDAPATYESGLEELKKLDAAGQQREKLIKQLETNREELDKVAQRYQQDADSGAKISEGLNKLVEKHPELDAFFVLTGNGYLSLTALGYETEFLPGLIDRASAAKDAVNRYDKAIKAAKDDLKSFNDLKSFFRRMYSFDPSAVDAQNLNPQGVDMNPGAVAKLLEQAKEATAKVQETAAALQAEADRINAHNAGISRFQGFVGLVRASMEVGRAVNSAPSATGGGQSPSAVYNYKMETKIIIVQPPANTTAPGPVIQKQH